LRRQANDISLGGIRLYSDEAFKVGSRLELEIFLPDDSSITVTARTVWVDTLPAGGPAAYEVGFAFVDISADHHALLANLFEL